ncbi:hypothetical protein M885DRAFT_329907 [Pelagophyceae sp. CCMP2097]|nr:hypothetical protein M885DRAFT_329907 [Pelagophyceae sp. CCMP2097]
MAAQTDVCIVGGGVGGLACALALRRAGVACQVFERDASFGDRRNGYGMTLSADDKGPLGQLGVLDACRALSCVSKSHFIFDGTGRVRGYYGRALRGDAPANDSPEKKRHTGRTGSLRVQRQQLRRVLLDALEALDVKVRWNSPLESYEESDAGVVATFAGGVQCECNALVGADGIRSLVRLQRDAALQSSGEATQDLRWLGVGVVVGISAHRHSLVEDRGFYMLTGSARLFTMPFAADMTMWQFSFKIEGDADDAAALLSNHGTGAKARLLAHALTLVPHRGADADGALGRVVEAVISATEDVWATPLYDRSAMPLPKRAKASRVTVLGDACHPMTCFKGAGGCRAVRQVLHQARGGRFDAAAHF